MDNDIIVTLRFTDKEGSERTKKILYKGTTVGGLVQKFVEKYGSIAKEAEVSDPFGDLVFRFEYALEYIPTLESVKRWKADKSSSNPYDHKLQDYPSIKKLLRYGDPIQLRVCSTCSAEEESMDIDVQMPVDGPTLWPFPVYEVGQCKPSCQTAGMLRVTLIDLVPPKASSYKGANLLLEFKLLFGTTVIHSHNTSIDVYEMNRTFDIYPVRYLPREASLKISVVINQSNLNLNRNAPKPEPETYDTIPFYLFDGERRLVSFTKQKFIVDNNSKAWLVIDLHTDEPHPIVFQERTHEKQPSTTDDIPFHKIEDALNGLVISKAERAQILWKYNDYSAFRCLPELLKVHIYDLAVRPKLHDLLPCLPLLPYSIALRFLSQKYADSFLRGYAVKCLASIDDDTLHDLLYFLIIALMNEACLDNPLARFLVDRSWNNWQKIGHYFYWFTKACTKGESSDKYPYEELLQIYAKGLSSPAKNRISKQEQFATQLEAITNIARNTRSRTPERTELLRDALTNLKETDISLPIPKFKFSHLIIDKCKFLDSMKLPISLAFQGFSVLIKCVEDVRENALLMSAYCILQKIWDEAGLPLDLTLYEVTPMFPQGGGIVEIVSDAVTVSSMSKGDVTRLFRRDTISLWLKAQNPTDDMYIDNFIKTVAAQSVATFIFGIGDRHNDNIMVNKHGSYFNIDHRVNMRYKFGIKRERAPFVLSPEMVHVIGDQWQRFVDLCCAGYSVARKHAELFTNLFRTVSSFSKPTDKFSLDKTDTEAYEFFTQCIYEAKTVKTTQISNAIYILPH